MKDIIKEVKRIKHHNNEKIKKTRICCKCNKEISEGYVVHLDKKTYIYCSEICMIKDGIDLDKFEEINDENPGDSYYYDWDQ